MTYKKINLREDDADVTLTAYVADETWRVRDAMLVIPGGGYGCVCDDREGEPIALAFLARGINSFVLKYSVGAKAVFPRPLADASLAMAYIKTHAVEFNINPDRVFCVGFSAGGHLAASLGTFWHDEECAAMTGLEYGVNKPAGTILCYAVLSARPDIVNEGTFRNLSGSADVDNETRLKYSVETHVDGRTAPAFFVHTFNDQAVNVGNALVTADAMSKAGVPFEMHIFPDAPHGIALANDLTSRGNSAWEDNAQALWVDLAVNWMKNKVK